MGLGLATLALLLAIIALALMTVPGVRRWGISRLAAVGVASLIVGLAAQPRLTNLIAGIQIAVTQPIHLEDAVIVEQEWAISRRSTPRRAGCDLMDSGRAP
jgi:small-conductance mechanosensitive channel